MTSQLYRSFFLICSLGIHGLFFYTILNFLNTETGFVKTSTFISNPEISQNKIFYLVSNRDLQPSLPQLEKHRLLKQKDKTDISQLDGHSIPSTFGSFSKNYRSTNELHTKAIPSSDWNIDTTHIPKNHLYVIVFTVWISESGNIDHIQFDELSNQPRLDKSVLGSIIDTKMIPATFENQPVPSIMTVEITIEPEY